MTHSVLRPLTGSGERKKTFRKKVEGEPQMRGTSWTDVQQTPHLQHRKWRQQGLLIGGCKNKLMQ